MNILVIYYSMYGHVHRMAQAVAEGIGLPRRPPGGALRH
jgi:flavodoxin